jgi:hypothetical protein
MAEAKLKQKKKAIRDFGSPSSIVVILSAAKDPALPIVD